MAALCSSSLSALSLSFTSTSSRISNAAAPRGTVVVLPCPCPCPALTVVESSASISSSSRRVLCGERPGGGPKRLASSSWPCGARRKLSTSTTTKTEAEEVLDDEDLRAGLNETVTEALKVMLAEDDKMLETFKDKVDFLGEFLVQDGQVEAARFMLILRGMLDHEVYPENEELQGIYKKAFNTLWCLLEDSGWLLKQPGAEIPEEDDDPGEPELEIRFS